MKALINIFMSTSSESSTDVCAVCKSGEAEPELTCENCWSRICSQCSVAGNSIHSHPNGPGLYLVCLICSSYLNLVDQFIETESLSWASLSARGSTWLSLSGAKLWGESQHLSIHSYDDVNLSLTDKEMIDKDVETGRSDPSTFNWEIKETLTRLYKASYKEDIKRVLKAYCIRNPKVGYCQGMNSVTVWLLLFTDPNNAFIMLCYLIEKWLLPDFYIGSSRGNSLNGFYIESTVIASILDYLIPSMQKSTLPTSEFSDFFSLQHLIQIFVSTVDMHTTVFLWDKLSEHGSIALIRGVVSLAIISEKAVRKGTHPIQILKMLNENRVAPQVKEIYSDLLSKVTSIRVEKLRKMARDLRAKQWMECERFVVRKLETASRFSKEEIEQLQERFIKLMQDMEGSAGSKRGVQERRPTIGLPANLQQKMEDYKGSHTIGISKPDFVKFLQEIAPGMSEYGEDLFDTFDEDQSGYLDFRELTIAMSFISKGDFEDKLRLCFDSYDTEKQGFLRDFEIQLFIERILTPYAKSIDEHPENLELKTKIVSIHEKISKLSSQPKGKISFSDFLNGIKADMFLYNCVSEYLGTEHRPQVSKIYSAMNFGTFSVPEEENKCKLCMLL